MFRDGLRSPQNNGVRRASRIHRKNLIVFIDLRVKVLEFIVKTGVPRWAPEPAKYWCFSNAFKSVHLPWKNQHLSNLKARLSDVFWNRANGRRGVSKKTVGILPQTSPKKSWKKHQITKSSREVLQVFENENLFFKNTENYWCKTVHFLRAWPMF